MLRTVNVHMQYTCTCTELWPFYSSQCEFFSIYYISPVQSQMASMRIHWRVMQLVLLYPLC